MLGVRSVLGKPLLYSSVCALVAALAATAWAQPGVSQPPCWAIIVAAVACVCGLTSIACVALAFFRDVLGRRSDFDELRAFLQQYPKLNGAVGAIAKNIGDGVWTSESLGFERAFKDLCGDFCVYHREWKRLKRACLFLETVGRCVCVIIVFAALYLADYTLEIGLSIRRQPGFDGVQIDQHTFLGRLVEAVYVSFSTFKTLGSGGIDPISTWARMITIGEMLLLGLIVCEATGHSYLSEPSPANLMNALRSWLKDTGIPWSNCGMV